MSDEQRKLYDALLKLSRAESPDSWAEWAEHVAAVVKFIRDTGTLPELINRVWIVPDANGGLGQRMFYMHDPTAHVVAARELLDSGII